MQKIKYATIIPKTESGKNKLAHHGDKWIVRGTVESLKFIREPGPFWVLMSRDGKKCLHINQKEDKDFNIIISQ